MLLAAGGGLAAGALIGTGVGWAAGVGAAEATTAAVTAGTALKTANDACGGDMCASEVSDAGKIVNAVTPVIENVEAPAAESNLLGQEVFRVWGTNLETPDVASSGPWGRSWSPIDPSTVTNFRNIAGLPNGGESGAINAARFVSQGVITDPSGIIIRNALPLDGNAGGLLEYIIPNPQTQIELINVSGVTPPY